MPRRYLGPEPNQQRREQRGRRHHRVHRDEKARAAFNLYDYNGDGVISLEEMTRYLTSVFRVMYETQPGTAERMGVSAEELAAVTAQQAFEDADLNDDGMLTFEEFQAWYQQPVGSSGARSAQAVAAATLR